MLCECNTARLIPGTCMVSKCNNPNYFYTPNQLRPCQVLLSGRCASNNMSCVPRTWQSLSGPVSGAMLQCGRCQPTQVAQGHLTGVNRWISALTASHTHQTANTPTTTCAPQLTLNPPLPQAVTMRGIAGEDWQKQMFTLCIPNKELLNLMKP